MQTKELMNTDATSTLQSGICSLPTELLCVIFSFTQALSAVIAMAGRKPSTCSQWRSVTQKLPDLWTYIPIQDSRSTTAAAVQGLLRRSNGLPLHIFLDIPSCTNRRRDGTAFQGIFREIMAASDRWAALRINTTAQNFKAMRDVECKAAPLLESLEIRLDYGPGRQTKLHLGPTPSLKSLVLHGMGLEIGDVSSFVDKLEVLEVATPNVVTKLAVAFASSGRETPRLRHLDLAFHIPPLKREAGAAFKKYVASLTSLSLGYVKDLGRIPSLLHSPLLEELSLHSLGTWRDDALGLFLQRLQTASLVFPALRMLTLSSIPECSFRELRYLTTAFPAVERLVLRNVEATPFIDLLSISGEWLNLRSLTIYPIDHYQPLCPMVDSRIEAGCPLTTLEIISARANVDVGALEWLKENVATVKELPQMFVY
ncbi:hypothetical protein DFH06DRAFT_1209138 [Mycena polygramma]|nr:hypothetical protein DFH06DRAFT_1209138 [Mycena polygramma]